MKPTLETPIDSIINHNNLLTERNVQMQRIINDLMKAFALKPAAQEAVRRQAHEQLRGLS